MKKRSIVTYTPTLEQRIDTLDRVYYEVRQLVYSSRLHHNDGWIENAFVESTLVHVRVLLDFFEHRKRSTFSRRDGCRAENDDVIAGDYGFPPKDLDIGEKYRLRLNKDLVHLSYSRNERRSQDAKQWPWREVVLPIIERSIEFISWLETGSFKGVNGDALARWDMLRTELLQLREGITGDMNVSDESLLPT